MDYMEHDFQGYIIKEEQFNEQNSKEYNIRV